MSKFEGTASTMAEDGNIEVMFKDTSKPNETIVAIARKDDTQTTTNVEINLDENGCGQTTWNIPSEWESPDAVILEHSTSADHVVQVV